MFKTILSACAMIGAFLPIYCSAEDVEDYVKRCQASRRSHIEQRERDVKSLRESLEKAKRSSLRNGFALDGAAYLEQSRKDADIKSRQAMLVAAEEDLARLRDPTQPIHGDMQYGPPRGGDIGRIPGVAKVVQVIDETTMLANVYFLGETTVWLRGIDTAGVADGQELRIGNKIVFHVSGTKKYETALGASRTVHVVEPIDVPAELYVKYAEITGLKPAEQKKAPSIPAAGLREWTDASGSFSVKARFRGMANGKVSLRTEDGRDLEVPLGKLSGADQKFIQDRGR